jgi:hypothetical protein
MPRPVNFCPWCGTAQGQGAARAASGSEADIHVRHSEVAAPLPPAAVPQPPQQPPQSVQPAQNHAETRRKGVTATVHAPQVPPSANDFGRSAASGRSGVADAPAAAAAQQEVPRPPIPARPGLRKPVQLRWWILALAILWGVWLLAKPSPKKIERQIDHAIALARECKGNDAQAELIALRGSRATPEQLERLQTALNEQSTICTRRRLRNKAWLEASAAADAALDAGSADRARARLQGFIRRWGEDDKTRALKARVDEAARRETHPLAVPPA